MNRREFIFASAASTLVISGGCSASPPSRTAVVAAPAGKLQGHVIDGVQRFSAFLMRSRPLVSGVGARRCGARNGRVFCRPQTMVRFVRRREECCLILSLRVKIA